MYSSHSFPVSSLGVCPWLFSVKGTLEGLFLVWLFNLPHAGIAPMTLSRLAGVALFYDFVRWFLCCYSNCSKRHTTGTYDCSSRGRGWKWRVVVCYLGLHPPIIFMECRLSSAVEHNESTTTFLFNLPLYNKTLLDRSVL